MKLRPYRELARAAVHKEWETVQSTLVEMATGAGKTRLASALILDRSTNGRALFVCHRQGGFNLLFGQINLSSSVISPLAINSVSRL